MANYPVVPSWRMPWDRDGSQMYDLSTNTAVQVDNATMRQINSETGWPWNYGPYTNGHTYCVIFPEHRDLDGYYLYETSDRAGSTVTVSTDTTNGIDGTWTNISTSWDYGPIIPDYRTKIQQTTSLGIKAIKFTMGGTGIFGDGGNLTFHLYGEQVPGEFDDRLEIWDPNLDQKADKAALDWGDVPRGNTASRTFRIKNMSATQTAQSCRVAMEVLSDTNPSILSQFTLAYNGGSPLAQVNVGDLAPGAISGLVTIGYNILNTQTMGLITFRVFSSAATWV